MSYDPNIITPPVNNVSAAPANNAWTAIPASGKPGQVLTRGPNNSPQWTNVNMNSWNMIDGTPFPTVNLKKYAGMGEGSNHSLDKVESKKWRVVNLSFKELILLQTHGIHYTWEEENDNVYMTFESEADESQAIMLIGTVPYDKD
jgi:hypothetical protein